MQKRIAVVILNFNGKHWLEKFLPSVLAYSSNADVIIADNGSEDDSLTFLNKHYPDVQQIILEQNYGFTGGYNRALFQLEHEYFVLLNSDIEVTENWLDAPIKLLDNNPKVAACQPKIKSYNRKDYFEHAGAAGGMIDYIGYPFCRGRIFMTAEKDQGQYEEDAQIFWATGAALFIRSQLYKEFNGLEEKFFAHMEEIELCWRLKNAGHQIMYCHNSVVYHVGGGTLNTSNPKKTFLNFRNGLALLFINLPKRKFLPVLFFRMVLDGVASLEFLFVGHWKDAWAVFVAHLSFYYYIKIWIKARLKARRKVVSHKHSEILKKSIVYQYFIKKNKYYKEML